MANKRIYWAVQAVAIAPFQTDDPTSFVFVHGVQSVGLTTTFNLEQVFELGQLQIYENIENIPDVEVTLEKVIDGYPLIYHLATTGAAAGTLAGRSNQRCQVALSIFDDTLEQASGTPIAEVWMSGMYVSNLTYTMPVEGNCTEAVTLVGNDKVWIATDDLADDTIHEGNELFFGDDEPKALTDSLGGVQRRENVLMDSLLDDSVSVLPGGVNGVEGISSSGTNDKVDGQYGAHIQNITVSADLGREALNELGRRGPYHRFVNFPVEVTCEIETISTLGDQVSATEDGVLGGGANLADKRIFIVLEDTTKLDLGLKNKLASVTYGGGDAGGGNATTTYSYTTFNDLTVTHVTDV
jgi:hypothetical protein